jgi:hypothetical protein
MTQLPTGPGSQPPFSCVISRWQGRNQIPSQAFHRLHPLGLVVPVMSNHQQSSETSSLLPKLLKLAYAVLEVTYDAEMLEDVLGSHFLVFQ